MVVEQKAVTSKGLGRGSKCGAASIPLLPALRHPFPSQDLR